MKVLRSISTEEHRIWSVKWRWREGGGSGKRRQLLKRGAHEERRAGSKPGWGVKEAGASQQLLLLIHHGGNRPWDRDGSGKIRECSRAGSRAGQRQAAQGLGRICEAGTAKPTGGEMKESLGLKAPSRELGTLQWQWQSGGIRQQSSKICI